MFLSFFLMIISIREYEGTSRGNYTFDNWTSCEEFLADADRFDPVSVLDINWKIFYFWHFEYERSYQIRFSTPSEQLIERYKVELNNTMKPPVQWSDAEFFMETSIDISALYIKQNTSGLYRIIPSFAVKMDSVPTFLIALKVVEPGYLGLMNCEYRLCYLLAPVEKMPPQEQIENIALKFNFVGDFNYTYMFSAPTPIKEMPRQDFASQEDEIEQDLDMFEIL